MCACECVCVATYVCYSTQMEIRGHLLGVSYLLPPCGFWGSISGRQVWLQVPCPLSHLSGSNLYFSMWTSVWSTSKYWLWLWKSCNSITESDSLYLPFWKWFQIYFWKMHFMRPQLGNHKGVPKVGRSAALADRILSSQVWPWPYCVHPCQGSCFCFAASDIAPHRRYGASSESQRWWDWVADLST